jgi:hypothetical protein
MSAYPIGSARRVSFGMTGSQKYRNKPTEADGIRFDSKKEAARWQALQLLERNGEVRNIRRQVPYKLEVAGKLICRYKADFVYEALRGLQAPEWHEVVEDVKGVRTPIYMLKKKLMRACLGIEIIES